MYQFVSNASQQYQLRGNLFSDGFTLDWLGKSGQSLEASAELKGDYLLDLVVREGKNNATLKFGLESESR